MGRGRGLLAFAAGAAKGYTDAKNAELAREEQELRIKKMRDERAMEQEFQQLQDSAKPTREFVVTTKDGTQTFADAKSAQAAAQGDEQSQIRMVYSVAGRQFDTRDEADQVAAAEGAPAAMLRKKIGIASKYNRPDLAAAWAQQYTTQMESNRREMFQTFSTARMTGDLSTLERAYNENLPNGTTASIAPGPNGSVVVRAFRAGKLVSETPYKSQDELWDAGSKFLMATPDNAVEIWKTNESIRAGKRDYDLRSKEVDASIRQGDTRNNIAQQQVGLQREQIGVQREQMYMPKPITGVDEDGNVVVSATQAIKPTGPKGAHPNGGLRVLSPETVKGLRSVPVATAAMRNADPFADMLGGGTQPLQIDWSKIPPKSPAGGQ